MEKNVSFYSFFIILTVGIMLITGCGKNNKDVKADGDNSINRTGQKQDDPKETEISSKGFTVKFYDGDDYLFSKTVDSNSIVSEPNIPQKTGYDFVAWYLENEKFDFNSEVTSDITLKAVWKKQNVSNNKKSYAVKFVLYDKNSITQNVSEGDLATKPENPVRKGYLFKGWSINGVSYDFSQKVTSDLTITADWQKLSTIKESTLSYATMNYKTLKEKLGGVESNSIKSWAHYDTDKGRGYYSGGYVTFANGYAGRFEFWTFESEDFDTILNSIQAKNISTPLSDLFNDYSSYSLSDENLKAIGATNILRVKERYLLQFMYDHYTIEVSHIGATGYEQLSIWDDNYVEND